MGQRFDADVAYIHSPSHLEAAGKLLIHNDRVRIGVYLLKSSLIKI